LNKELDPDILLRNIKNWITKIPLEGKDFTITEENNPEFQFSLLISANWGDNAIMPIHITYPKGSDSRNSVIIIGWHWTPEIDVKAFKSIKDDNLKRRVINSIKSACISRNLYYGLDEDISNVVYRLVSAHTINGDILKYVHC
jgi:hypothetical protein